MTLSGGCSLWRTVRLPSESKNVFIWGMSKSKLILCLGILILMAACITAAVFSFRHYSTEKIAGISSFIIIYILILCKIFLTPPVGNTSLERSLLERLSPVLGWGSLFSVSAFTLLTIQKFSELRNYLFSSASALIFGGIVFLVSSAAILFSLRSGIGIEPVSATFYRQGVSLLEAHLIIPLLFLSFMHTDLGRRCMVMADNTF